MIELVRPYCYLFTAVFLLVPYWFWCLRWWTKTIGNIVLPRKVPKN